MLCRNHIKQNAPNVPNIGTVSAFGANNAPIVRVLGTLGALVKEKDYCSLGDKLIDNVALLAGGGVRVGGEAGETGRAYSKRTEATISG